MASPPLGRSLIFMRSCTSALYGLLRKHPPSPDSPALPTNGEKERATQITCKDRRTTINHFMVKKTGSFKNLSVIQPSLNEPANAPVRARTSRQLFPRSDAKERHCRKNRNGCVTVCGLLRNVENLDIRSRS